MNLRPFDSWLTTSAEAAAAPIGAIGAERALGVPPDLASALVSEQDAAAADGLGALNLQAPAQPGTSTRPARERVRAIIDDAFFRAADAISDGIAHQFMSVSEQGELLSRYRANYGVVRQAQP